MCRSISDAKTFSWALLAEEALKPGVCKRTGLPTASGMLQLTDPTNQLAHISHMIDATEKRLVQLSPSENTAERSCQRGRARWKAAVDAVSLAGFIGGGLLQLNDTACLQHLILDAGASRDEDAMRAGGTHARRN